MMAALSSAGQEPSPDPTFLDAIRVVETNPAENELTFEDPEGNIRTLRKGDVVDEVDGARVQSVSETTLVLTRVVTGGDGQEGESLVVVRIDSSGKNEGTGVSHRARRLSASAAPTVAVVSTVELRGMGRRALLWLSVFSLGGALPANAQEPRFVEDNGHIVVIEHDGESYDRDTTDGELNAAPRQRLARKLIETHGDFYDFIVVFTNFDFDRKGVIGFYTNVRNDVAGIGLPVVDNGESFGSPARLQGFVDMGPIDQYRSAPFSLERGEPDFRATLGVLAHEIGHRWLAGVRFDNGGGPRSDLLGLDGAHWSFLLSSRGVVSLRQRVGARRR